jgi:acetolactate decarboxylase
MKKLLLFLLLFFFCGCACSRTDSVYQYSAIGAFMRGGYEGDKRVGDIRRGGDFGLGTFDGIDGEMIALDGKYYQVKSDGRVYVCADAVLSPFAQVKFFKTDNKIIIEKAMSLEELKSYLNGVLGSKNVFSALRIDGEYSYVKARSIGLQDKPYKPFQEVAKEQCVFELKNVKGTVAGFYSPDYFPQVSPPGYHFHFLSADREAGGHVLDLRIEKGVVFIDRAMGLNLEFPDDETFLDMDFSVDKGIYK